MTDDIVLNADLNIDQLKQKAQDIQDEIEMIFQKSSGNDDLSLRFKRGLASLNQYHSRLVNLQSDLSDVINAPPITTERYDAVITDLKKLEAEYAKLTKNIDTLSKAKEHAESINNAPTDEYKSMQAEITKAETALNELVAKQKELANSGVSETDPYYQWLNQQIEGATLSVTKLHLQLNNLKDSGKAFTNNDEEIAQYTSDLERAEQQLADVAKKQEELNQKRIEFESNDTDYINATDTQKADSLKNSLTDVINKSVIAKEGLYALDEVDFSNVDNNVSTFEQELLNTINLIRDIPNGMKRIFSAFGSGLANAGKSLASFAKSSLINYLKAVPKWLAKATVEAGKLAGNLARLAGSGILNGIKRLSGAFGGLSKHTDSTNINLEKGFKTFIKYAFGVRSFFFLFRKIRSAVIKGFGDLAQVSEPFNQAVSNILTALTMLRNSLSSAFSPIIETVSPILTHLINQLSEVITKIGMMIAALTGQKTYMRALPVQQNYAESVAKTSKNSDKAAKSTKKLNNETEKLQKTLAGFDDVEILKGPDDNNDNGYDSGLDGLGDSLTDAVEPAFEQVPIGELFTDFSDLLKRAWEKADFTEVGKIIGEKLKSALEKIPWNKIKKVLRKIGKSIATLLNGFLEVPGLFDDIGRTIAEGLNSAFEIVESFVSNFHWSSLGNAIRDLILGVLQNIDWPLIYKTMEELGSGIGKALNKVVTDDMVWSEIFTALGNKFEAILTLVKNFVMNVDWIDFGQSIGKGLNDGVENFDWNLLAETLVRSINNAFDFWYNFVTTFDFTKFGEHIGTTLSEIINHIDWTTGSASVAETLNGLLSALNGFLETTDFASIGHKVVSAIATFLDTFSWSEFGESLSKCLQAMLDFFLGIYENINWSELPRKIFEKISAFMTGDDEGGGFDWEGVCEKVLELIGAAFRTVIELYSLPGRLLWELGKALIEGIKKGMTPDLGDITNWITEHVWNPFAKGFTGAYGITNKSSKETEPFGEAVSTGIKDGVENKWGETPKFIREHETDLVDPITSNKAIADYKDAGHTVPENVATGVEEKWSDIENTIDPKVSAIIDPFISGNAQQGYRYAGQMVVVGIMNGMNSESSSLYITAQNIAIEAYNAMVSALDIGSPSKLFRKGIGKMIPAGVALGILDNEGLVENAMDSLTGTVTNVSKKALEIPAIVKGGVIPYQATISTQTENALNDVVDMLQSNYTDKLTSDELQDILVTVISQYLNIDFYIGDEQIARHANNGNVKLGRRYNKFAFGGT